MGDSRSWAADMEDEMRKCKHGKYYAYFSICQCQGCKDDREETERVTLAKNVIRQKFRKRLDEILDTLPEKDWNKIISVNIKDN